MFISISAARNHFDSIFIFLYVFPGRCYQNSSKNGNLLEHEKNVYKSLGTCHIRKDLTAWYGQKVVESMIKINKEQQVV